MANAQSLSALLDQTGWIHALARRLVADPHLADDLVQETCVGALEQQPDADRPLRGWLATVMRSRLARLRRGEDNRSARERGASRGELEPSTLDVLERAEAHRNVVLAVLALEEPYRSTLLMRFFEQLSYNEIARRTGLTRAAVNSRVTRGLERLRQRLEAGYGGDRRALALALLPLAKLPTGFVPTLFGVNLMSAWIGTTAATLLAVTAVIGFSGGEPRTGAVAYLPPEPARGPQHEPPRDELSLPFGFQRAPMDLGAELPGAPQQGRREKQQADEDQWKTQILHVQDLAPTIETLAVNSGSGDITVLETLGNQLEIEAHVTAQLSKVSRDRLSQLFEDHVEITEEKGVLKVEDRHHDERGWSVSFVLRVPVKLALIANSGSGDILVRRARGVVRANTGSGDVEVALAGESVERLDVNTGSGDMRIEVQAVADELNVNTGSGDVVLRVAGAASEGQARINTGSGDVLLVLAPGVSARLDLENFSGELRLPDVLGVPVERDITGRRKATATSGSGIGGYALRSGSGDLVVELGNALPAPEPEQD